MTDLPHDPLDELASAHLDDQTSPEEAARIVADPALLARVDVLRTVRDAVRSSDVPPDPARRDAAIAAALLAADAPAASVGAVITPLAPARRARAARTRLVLAGVAAAAIAAAVVVPRLGDDGGSSDTLASRTAAPESADDRFATDAAGGDSAADTPLTTLLGPGTQDPSELGAPTSSTVFDFGAAADLPQLGVVVRASFDATAPPPAASVSPEAATCLGQLEGDAVRSSTPERPVSVVQRGLAVVGGRSAVLAVTATGPDTSYVLRAAAVDGCAPLGEVTLAPFTVEHPAPGTTPGGSPSDDDPAHEVPPGDDPAHEVPPGQENP